MRLTAGLAALSGFAAVALGAFAAHGLQGAQAKAWAETAFQHHAFHTLACFVALWLQRQGAPLARFAPPLFFVGIALFCGALYALALGAPRGLAAAAPVGGLSFLAGWLVLAVSALRLRSAS